MKLNKSHTPSLLFHNTLQLLLFYSYEVEILKAKISRRKLLATAGGVGAVAAGGRLLWPTGDLRNERTQEKGWLSPLNNNKARLNQLLRRTCFGYTESEIERAYREGYAKTLERILSPIQTPLPYKVDITGNNQVNINDLQKWWYEQMLATSSPLGERMTLFWHGHFTSDYRKAGLQQPYIYWQNLTWRDRAYGNLSDFLYAVTIDPAMLRYLDLASSTGNNPNENYSRELLELFTLGAGNFNETDVRNAAKALAGWVEPSPSRYTTVIVDKKNNVTQKRGVFDNPGVGSFQKKRAFLGSTTILGKTATFDTKTLLGLILSQKSTAPFIVSKLLADFAHPTLNAAWSKRLASNFVKNNYDIHSLLSDIFSSEEFFVTNNYRALVKNPTEFMIHCAKALGTNSTNSAALMVVFGKQMGQSLFDPPDVGGWPKNSDWINSNSVLARVNYVTALLAQTKTVPNFSHFIEYQLDSTLSNATKAAIDAASDDHSRWLIALSCPEFQLK